MKNLLVLLIFIQFTFSSCDNSDKLETVSISKLQSNNSNSGVKSTPMTIKDGYMYIIDHDYLRVMDVRNSSNHVEVYSERIGDGIESVFAYEGYLYMGGTRAVYIYNLQKKDKPAFTSANNHRLADDPVIVQGNYAYSTLQGRNENTDGALEVIDVSNKSNPQTKLVIPQKNPHGLAISKDILYVCNGKYGMNLFELNESEYLVFNKNIMTEPIYNCIVVEDVLIGQTKKGILFYNIKNRLEPVLIFKSES